MGVFLILFRVSFNSYHIILYTYKPLPPSPGIPVTAWLPSLPVGWANCGSPDDPPRGSVHGGSEVENPHGCAAPQPRSWLRLVVVSTRIYRVSYTIPGGLGFLNPSTVSVGHGTNFGILTGMQM